MPVVEVGIGVGYFVCPWFLVGEQSRFAGRGKPGDEESGSNAGRSEGADRLSVLLLNGGRAGSDGPILSLEGLSSIIVTVFLFLRFGDFAASLRC